MGCGLVSVWEWGFSVRETGSKDRGRTRACVCRNSRRHWEPVGRRREYLDTAHALHMALNRTLRDIEVLSVRDYDTAPPSWMHRGNHASWFEAQRLRRAILAATNPTRPPG